MKYVFTFNFIILHHIPLYQTSIYIYSPLKGDYMELCVIYKITDEVYKIVLFTKHVQPKETHSIKYHHMTWLLTENCTRIVEVKELCMQRYII